VAWLSSLRGYSVEFRERHVWDSTDGRRQGTMRTRIKEFRAKHNLTQGKLAEIVGVRRETIIFLEQGKYNPSLRLAHNVARALKTNIDEIFIFED